MLKTNQQRWELLLRQRAPYSSVNMVFSVIALCVAPLALPESAAQVSSQSDRHVLRDAEVRSPISIYSGLSIATPVKLTAISGMLGMLPEETRTKFKELTFFDSGSFDTPHLSVMRVIYKDEVAVNIDAVILSATFGTLYKMSQPNLNEWHAPPIAYHIDRLPARRIKFENHASDGDLVVDTVCVTSGNVLWQVQAIYRESKDAELANSILESIRIKTGSERLRL